MKVKITVIICIIVLIWGLNKIDYTTNSYFGNPSYGLYNSIKTDVEKFFKKMQKN